MARPTTVVAPRVASGPIEVSLGESGLAAATADDYEFDVAGAVPNAPLFVWSPDLPAEVIISHAFVGEKGKVTVRLFNTDAVSAADPENDPTFFVVQL